MMTAKEARGNSESLDTFIAKAELKMVEDRITQAVEYGLGR